MQLCLPPLPMGSAPVAPGLTSSTNVLSNLGAVLLVSVRTYYCSTNSTACLLSSSARVTNVVWA